MEWTSVEDRLPTKEDGWIGYVLDHKYTIYYFIRVLVIRDEGYGRIIDILEFRVLLSGEWTHENDKCEVESGIFLDPDVTMRQPLPALPEPPVISELPKEK